MKVTFSIILLLLISVTIWSFITSMNSKGNRKGKSVGSRSTNPPRESKGKKKDESKGKEKDESSNAEPLPEFLRPNEKIQDELIKYYADKHEKFATAKKEVETGDTITNMKTTILDRITDEESKVFILLNLYIRNFSKGENVSYIENF